jgi:ParB/RepB/Spo0J family partition protein
MSKRQANGVQQASAAGVAVMIKIEKLIPSPDNGRQWYDRDKLKGLAASMKTGIAQPLLVRPRPKGFYEIVTGWRRWMAGKIAKLKELPCVVRELTDDEVARLRALENLQREPLDPMDEAAEFARLLEKTKSLKGLARELGQDAKSIARRIPLATVIEDVAEDLRARRISVGHALEIARLPHAAQAEALIACYGHDWKNGERVPNKDDLELTVEELRQWIGYHVLLDLARAPFRLDDERLREDGLTCLKCPQRTGHNQMLFADLKGNKDHCLDRACFNNKASQFIKLEAVRIKKNGGDEPAPIIASNYYGETPEGMLGRNSFVVLQKAGERCDSAERGIWGEGPEFGKTAWICRDQECQTHARRVNGHSSSRPSANGRQAKPGGDLQRANRRQEIFDIKVNEAARRMVFKESLPTYTDPLPREMREQVALAFFERLSGHHRKVIEAVIEQEVTAESLAAMDDNHLVGFLMFCTFAHYGANEYGYNRSSQRDIIRLAEERGVNYALIDAETRVALSPKKYMKQHQLYLDEVKAGKAVSPPNVYGGSPITQSSGPDCDAEDADDLEQDSDE